MSAPTSLRPVIEIVPLDRAKPDVFKNKIPMWDASKGYQRPIFGGHLLGQSVMAAKQTVSAAFDVHSLQTVFLKAGDAKLDVHYHVERVLDGRTLSSRLVRAKQGDVTIFHATIGFQRYSDTPAPPGSALKFDAPMPEWARSVEPGGEGLLVMKDILVQTGFPDSLVQAFRSPFEWYYLQPEPVSDPTDFRLRAILRSPPLTNDRAVQLAALAWMTDAFLIYTSNLANPAKFPLGMAGVVIETTVNHSVWFHSPSARIDEWLVCERRTSWGADGRVLIYQELWNKADGQLILSCVQEALLRLKTANL